MSELHKFLFDGLPVRGMLVRLTDAWREVLSRRDEDGHAHFKVGLDEADVARFERKVGVDGK